MLFYISLMIWLLNYTGLWDTSQIKNTIVWCVTVATVMLFRANVMSENKHFFKAAILDNLKIIVILEFIINVHTLNIWLELILVPLSTFLILLVTVAELDKKHELVASLINGILIALGTILIIYALYTILTDMPSFTTYANFQSFVLPPIMSIIYIPFMYFIALIMTYQVLFVRLGFFADNPALHKHAKLLTLQHFNINLYNLKLWSNFISYQHFKNKESVNEAIHEFKTTT